MKIKYIVFSIRNVIIALNETTKKAGINEKLLDELTKLVHFLRKRNIEPVVYANREWTKTSSGVPLEELIKKLWGKDMAYYITARDQMPPKPKPEAIPALLEKLECEENEILFVGNSVKDMQAAVNGHVVFLNAIWFSQNNKYGFVFSSPKDIARFVDIFFYRQHLWSFKIEEAKLRYYSLAPYGTYDAVKELYGDYSHDARRTAKDGLGHPDFWGRYFSSALLLSGIYKEINFICPFPAHTANTWKDPLQNSLDTFEKCFRGRYLKDLIIRHTTSTESHTHRDSVNHVAHLNTIKLNPNPTYSNGKSYKKSPLESGRTVLVIDDFCTQGYSLEAARIYLEKTGVNVILFSWLKTINRPYIKLDINIDFDFNPYKANDWTEIKLNTKVYTYDSIFTDREAYVELNRKFNDYISRSY